MVSSKIITQKITHPWDLEPSAAIALQRELADQVIRENTLGEVSTVAGVDAKANWQGGDFAGLTKKIEEGYFDRLGVTALWISSVSQNTPGSGLGSDGHTYAGYHSYWLISPGWTSKTPLAGVEPADPHFGSLDISGLSRVAPPPPQPARFVLDGHLGRLAGEQGRIVLSRDRGVLKRRQVIHGYAPRRDDPRAKLLPPHTRESYSRLHRCRDCGRIYWRGAHAQRIEALIAAVRSQGLEAGATETRPPVSPRGSC
jgi:hypothetical protein